MKPGSRIYGCRHFLILTGHIVMAENILNVYHERTFRFDQIYMISVLFNSLAGRRNKGNCPQETQGQNLLRPSNNIGYRLGTYTALRGPPHGHAALECSCGPDY